MDMQKFYDMAPFVIIALLILLLAVELINNGGFNTINTNLGTVLSKVIPSLNKIYNSSNASATKSGEGFNAISNQSITLNTIKDIVNSTNTTVNKQPSWSYALNQNAIEQSTDLIGISSNVVILPGQITAAVNASLKKYFKNLTLQSNTMPINTITVWTFTQSAGQGNWLVNQMLDTFFMHLKFNASNAINVNVLTLAEYANFSTGNTYTVQQSYSSIGSFNSISFEFDTSSGCGAYVYVVSGYNNEPFILYPNVSATYSPSATLQGVCH